MRRRKKKCARLRPLGFRSVAAGRCPLLFDEQNEADEEELDNDEEDCCNTDEESNTTMTGVAEDNFRFRLLHRHPSQLILSNHCHR